MIDITLNMFFLSFLWSSTHEKVSSIPCDIPQSDFDFFHTFLVTKLRFFSTFLVPSFMFDFGPIFAHLKNCVRYCFEMKSNTSQFLKIISETFLARTTSGIQSKTKTFLIATKGRACANRVPSRCHEKKFLFCF